MTLSPRTLLRTTTAAWLALGLLFVPASGLADVGTGTGTGTGAKTIQVYKTPTCGCCTKWIDHLKAAGFTVEATNLASLDALKAMNGVPAGLSSCHTAIVEGYIVEGHVPASDVERLLKERPKVAGLAVPGMPMGSPGMEHSDPRRHETYQVMSFGEQGIAVYSTHRP